MNGWTRFFLVLLRLAIGWHFLFEGLDKIRSVEIGPTETNRPWTSKAYLRESSGPFAEYFRRQAGDTDEQALALLEVQPLPAGQDAGRVPPRQRISPVLDQAWSEYFEHFQEHYQLSDEQKVRAQAKLDQAKDQAVRWLLGESGEREVEKVISPSATIKVTESGKQRVAAYRAKVQEIRDIETKKLLAFDRDVEKARLRTLKAETNRQRTELLADLQKPMVESLQAILTDEQAKKGPLTATSEDRPWYDKTRLEWTDWITIYGLTAVGACLLLGLFTRTACVGAAAFLLMFYLSMPPFPWVPENPRAEGHYLFVNKNLIEMLAALALATTRSGRWFGLDALLALLTPWGRRSVAASRPAEEPLVAASR